MLGCYRDKIRGINGNSRSNVYIYSKLAILLSLSELIKTYIKGHITLSVKLNLAYKKYLLLFICIEIKYFDWKYIYIYEWEIISHIQTSTFWITPISRWHALHTCYVNCAIVTTMYWKDMFLWKRIHIFTIPDLLSNCSIFF